jgi:hypothetical protein
MIPNVNEHRPGDFGWICNPLAVEQTMAKMEMAVFKSCANSDMLVCDESKDSLLYEYFRKVTGGDAPKGPQGIGDCVSWGWGNGGNYLQVVQILDVLHKAGLLQTLLEGDGHLRTIVDSALQDFVAEGGFEYQEVATEAMYGFSRVEVGGQHGSYQDGSVGAWAAKAATDFGYLSRKVVGAYSAQRAKEWGAKGVPDNLEPEAKLHTCKVASLVTRVQEAIAVLQNAKTPIPICSNQGFSMTRDSQGFCRPQGTWNHCMLLVGYRADRPGFCISQSWGPNTPSGPLDKGQPDNTFWADVDVVARILAQEDSFAPNTIKGWQKRNYIDWSF